ncbi:MAG: hypothetical protein GAK39_03514 [Variovorax sp.]|nr:MAG: hypothetical protein GAK39_03514 [Variovorax sp.]
MPTAEATRLRVSTWLLPLNTMPLRLTTITVPSAWIRPWICEGRACGSLTRLSTAQLGCCSNFSVVLRPTLKLSQLRIACGAVCAMVTCVWPPLCDSTGALALTQPAVRLAVSTRRPPSARPSGTPWPLAMAVRRAASCAACWAAMPRAARFRLPIERCSCSPARCCCACGLTSAEAGMPLGSRPVASAVLCAMFFCAIQPALKARCACAAGTVAPAASISAMAWTSGRKPFCGVKEKGLLSLRRDTVLLRCMRTSMGSCCVARSMPRGPRPRGLPSYDSEATARLHHVTKTSRTARATPALRRWPGPAARCRPAVA